MRSMFLRTTLGIALTFFAQAFAQGAATTPARAAAFVAQAEKELAEQGVNQRQVLASQKLHRPAVPGEDWNYWKFDGEFWRDEIGYYQYTLKKGCGTRE